MNTITTPNMLEVAYLLDRQHHITKVARRTGWPYGVTELAVTLAGDNIDLDHHTFLRHGLVSTAAVMKALDHVHRVLASLCEGGQV